VKKLIRSIMLSSVYQQSSDASQDNLKSQISNLKSIDPDNRLLWRQNRRRLDFEAMRDAVLVAAGELDFATVGPSVDLAKQPFSRRRTVYGFVERQNLPGMLRTFDFASPDHHSPQRFTTTVPQQALFLMNSPFVVEQARRLASRPDVLAEADPGLRLQRFYRHALGRAATSEEIELGLDFVQLTDETPASTPDAPLPMNRWEQAAHVLLLSNEFMFVD